MSAVHYCVEAADLHAHLFKVTLTLDQPAARQTVSLPVWIPGSYLVREFSKNLQNLVATQGRKKIAITQRDKCTWDMDCKPGQALVLSYEVYAFDASVRTAWLDTQRGFFNGTSLCLRVHGFEETTHQLQLKPVKGQASWQAATGLTPVKSTKKALAFTKPTTTPIWSTARSSWARFGVANSPPAASRTASSWQGPCRLSMVSACWPTPRKFVKPRSAFGMARANLRARKPRIKITCSC